MPTTITRPNATRRKYPPCPERDGLLSLDPADWWMYCDRLQDSGAPPARWRWAKRVGDSLHAEPRLLLLAINGSYYPRVVLTPRDVENLREYGRPTPEGWPAWVKPGHIRQLRWCDDRRTNDEFIDRETLVVAVTPFTPDCLPDNGPALELYRYACDYYTADDYGLGPPPQGLGERFVREAFIECHGRLNVSAELDARKKWHI